MKRVKFCVAVLLWPACVAMTATVLEVARALAAGPLPLWRGPGAAFFAGYGLWLVVFAVLPRPVRMYVLGHELTHALWALLMGARVSGLRVRESGGQVRTSKSNWVIALAPYFFPFYAMLFIAVFFAVHAVAGLERHMNALFFLIGLGWSFHVTFSLLMLLHTDQPDVRSQGRLFSLVVIYCMNLLMIALTIAALSRSVSLAFVFGTLAGDLAWAYGWVLDKLLRVWQHAGGLSVMSV
jgi:hypothetical protein